jgi:hypothetical protein
MDLWLASHNEIKAAALKYFHKMPDRVLKQSGLFAYVYFNDGTNGTVYGWMLN